MAAAAAAASAAAVVVVVVVVAVAVAVAVVVVVVVVVVAVVVVVVRPPNSRILHWPKPALFTVFLLFPSYRYVWRFLFIHGPTMMTTMV